MDYYQIKISQALELIRGYNFNEPLVNYLKAFFRSNKKYGGKDRRIVKSLVFSYFRLGNACKEVDSIKMQLAIYMNPTFEVELLQVLLTNQILRVNINIDFNGKVQLVENNFNFKFNDIFIWKDNLSDGIDETIFNKSLLNSLPIWIRIIKKRDNVIQELNDAKIEFNVSNELANAIKIKASVSLTDLESFKLGFFEIQDFSSQLCCSKYIAVENQKWWDCCAASGGKSLNLLQNNNNIELTVTDSRKSIMNQLSFRFDRHKLTDYKSLTLELGVDNIPYSDNYFDNIIADLPCSGSGTWQRAPENLLSFSDEKLQGFIELQKKILDAIIPKLKKNGKLYYSTCSVFKSENELQINYIVNNGFELENQFLFNGNNFESDTMFLSIFKKNI